KGWSSTKLRGSGRRLPLLALGTGGMGGQSARAVIAFALRAGYRHLDSAVTYPSFPEELQRGLDESGVPRSEVFISTKVSPDAMGFEATQALALRLVEEMPGGYADLCMVHWPDTAEKAPTSAQDPALWSSLERVGTWKALEAAYDAGVCKALGVCNFLVKHLKELLSYARVPPAVNQIEYSPTAPLADVVDFCRAHGIVIEAFAWNRLEVLMQEELLELTHRLSPTPTLHRDFAMQVLMRWFMQQGMVPLFRSERQEVVLQTAEGLLNVPNLTEAQIESLRKPRSDYPWKYYSAAAPWRTPVLATKG
ncbi:yvgN, partial [Symbiodinium pilosum]